MGRVSLPLASFLVLGCPKPEPGPTEPSTPPAARVDREPSDDVGTPTNGEHDVALPRPMTTPRRRM